MEAVTASPIISLPTLATPIAPCGGAEADAEAEEMRTTPPALATTVVVVVAVCGIGGGALVLTSVLLTRVFCCSAKRGEWRSAVTAEAVVLPSVT